MTRKCLFWSWFWSLKIATENRMPENQCHSDDIFKINKIFNFFAELKFWKLMGIFLWNVITILLTSDKRYGKFGLLAIFKIKLSNVLNLQITALSKIRRCLWKCFQNVCFYYEFDQWKLRRKIGCRKIELHDISK